MSGVAGSPHIPEGVRRCPTPERERNATFDDEAAVKSLFGGDSVVVGWRDQFGPNRMVLCGCRMMVALEQAIGDSLMHGGKAPIRSVP
ncbi:hypothetical protein RHOFW104T7_13835 [Rhodanobacter thiooxydans]|uniref:Uncharacterized protein n=1 Tax=Rhodanobacter thiooxydans TaxID=416169 RepID=A0A154QGV0_9GAMM|nr:hypothetical protein [Rhodanobacter thiooxydans]EIL97798.1 hypothetical protein UUA_14057 [Rhodanobacter thiooxydans LCS2]KZC23396.1 hypothetical protein RHOFW104T7_13835 [Rhodanobacter thiooxydans]MCW0200288.1 hypothetical protein [Rhodanobacter thiooxydans]